MTVKVAINGFGRIGRNILRAIVESGRKDIQVVAINDLGPVETNAHLLRYDSVHGRFPHEVKVAGDTIDVGMGKIKVTAIRNPAELPHKALGIDIALECTGLFTARDKAKAHLDAGARRVLISAPGESADLTVVFGVNHDKLKKDHLVVSNGSCTTNCLAPVAKVLNDAVGIERGYMTTVHSYTGDQPTLDTMHKDLLPQPRRLALADTDDDRRREGAGTRPARAAGQARRQRHSRADAQCFPHRPQDRRLAQNLGRGSERGHEAGLRAGDEGGAQHHGRAQCLDGFQPRPPFGDLSLGPDEGDRRELRQGALLVR